MAYQRTTATKKISSLTKRLRGVSGGTSASKTISILIWLIGYAQTVENELISVVSESMPHLKRGAMRDFLNIMQEHHYYQESRWNSTDKTYTFETGSKIEFFSADSADKVRGPRRQVLFVNEANNISYETFTQLEIRTSKIVWLDWNPVSEFWWYTEVVPNHPHDFLILTYKDNEALPESVVRALEARRYNKGWWKVYGEGQLGEAEGRIYTGWNMIDEIPYEARLERYGLDFGYTNDPTAIVAIYKYNDGYILDERTYLKGLSNKQIADILMNVPKALVIADSSEPKSIDEIASYGITILPSQKGPGSVLQGIQYVQDQRISVTKSSVNLIKEYRNYLWMTDRDGKIINEPEDLWNHCFVYDTPILTSKGSKLIGDMKVGDEVITSVGVKKVLKKWDNGVKPVKDYSLQFDTHSVELRCTEDHLVKTTKGWIQISKLQSGMEIFLNKDLMGRCTASTLEKDTSQEDGSECTSQYGKLLMAKSLKGATFTTGTKTRGTTGLRTLSLNKEKPILPSIQRSGLKTIQRGLRAFKNLALKRLRDGIKVKRGESGTKSMEKGHGLTETSESLNVKNAAGSIRPDTGGSPNTVTQTAKLVRLDVGESSNEQVYDLTVEDSHEYFANGVLVHNCMDAVRYGLDSFQKPKTYRGVDVEEEIKKGNPRPFGGVGWD